MPESKRKNRGEVLPLSVAWALASPEAKARVQKAQEEAVQRALAELEEVAASVDFEGFETADSDKPTGH